MKLAHCDFELTLSEQNINILIVEDPKRFCDFCLDMQLAVEEGESGFILSKENKILNIGKVGVFIGNPISISFADKKLINALYSEITEIAYDKYTKEVEQAKRVFSELLYKINIESSVAFDSDCDVQIAGILKAFGVGFKDDYDSFFEKFYDYISVLLKLCHISFLCFVNLKSFFSREECSELYKLFRYYDVFVLSIDSFALPKYEGEFTMIIDKDLCEIIA